MRDLLFHTNLKFQLPVLQVSEPSVHSVSEILSLISYAVKDVFFGWPIVRKISPKIMSKCLVAACTRNIVGTHSVQSVQPRHTQKQSVLQSVHSTLGYTTSFSAKRSVVLTN